MKPTIAELSAGCIVYKYTHNGPRILLLKNRIGAWGFAKGHIENGENLHQCAIRETQEETGITDVEIHPLFHIHYVEHKEFETEFSYKTVHLFLTKTTQNITISDEHTEYIWADINTAITLIQNENQKAALRRAKPFCK